MQRMLDAARELVTLTACVTAAIAGLSASAQGDTAIHKAGRGLAAISAGFPEVPGNVVHELATAPIEAPDDFWSLLEPEYPWSYFGAGRQIADSGYPRVARCG